MKNYKEDVDFSFQGFVDIKTANWKHCIERDCPLLPECEKSFAKTDDVDCIYPEKQVWYECERQDIQEDGFSAMRHNATGNTFISDFLDNCRGTASTSLEFNAGAVSTRFNDEGEPNGATTLVSDGRILGFGTVINGGTYPMVTSKVTFDSSSANTLSTTITGTPASKTTFDIVSASGLAINDLVYITQTAPLGRVPRKVTGLSSTTVTLNEALDSIPVSGNVFEQSWSRAYLLTNSDGSSTGTVASSIPYTNTKASGTSKNITFTLRVKGS